MSRQVTLCARSVSVPAGLIGLVYTAPAFRARGFAAACVQACVEDLRAGGAWLAGLWSDKPAFYAKLGFLPAGRETFLGVDPAACAEALVGLGVPPGAVETGPVAAGDFRALEALYASREVRAERAPGELARHAASVETELQVARLAGRPVAYAALGRGDDFRGVVHDWAGSAEGVLACLEALARPRGGVAWLIGPEPHPAVTALRALGAPLQHSPFALVRLLAAGRLWQTLVSEHPDLDATVLQQVGASFTLRGALGEVEFDAREALDLLFAGHAPNAVSTALDETQRAALLDVLPWPLYLWGFDSI